MSSIPKVKKVDSPRNEPDEGFWHVRFRQPSQFEEIRTPGWAANAAQSISKGAKVRMGRTPAGNWLVQSVLIKQGAGSRRKVVAQAKKIVREIEE